LAAGSTYTPIATTTLGSAATSYTFSSIPSTYTDLVLICNTAITTGSSYYLVQFNSDTGSNYSATRLRGNGSAATSGRDTSATQIYTSSGATITTTSLENNLIMNVMNYSNTSTYKTVIGKDNAASIETDAYVGLWRSTAAINTIKISIGSSTFIAGSTFTLYGISCA
jgi:hypothetical protein